MKTSFAIKTNGRCGFYGPGFHQKRQFSAHSLWPKGCCTASFKMLFQIMIMAQLVTGCKVWASLSPPLLRWRWSWLGSASCDRQTVTNKTENNTAFWKFKIHKWAVEGSVWIYGIAPWYMGGFQRTAEESNAVGSRSEIWFHKSGSLELRFQQLYMFSCAIDHSQGSRDVVGCPNICSSG